MYSTPLLYSKYILRTMRCNTPVCAPDPVEQMIPGVGDLDIGLGSSVGLVGRYDRVYFTMYLPSSLVGH